MKTIAYLIILMLIIVSCGSADEQKNASKTSDASSHNHPGNTDISGCYRSIVNEDTAELHITKNGEKVEGQLSYHRKEKDNNEGSFTGQMLSDSILLVHYSFASEGVRSVRQVVFKIRDSLILQGYGEEHSRRDTAFLRDPKLAVYDTKHPFRKGCD
jgi:hypothetical protein